MTDVARNGGPAVQVPKITVLCVDDEPALLELTTIFLGRDGDLAIDTTLSAKAGLQKIRENTYDVIVADYLMPGMDGIEFLKELRSSGCNIPFIIFTGKGREAVAIEALNSGADFYLQKGGDPKSQFAELGNMIRQAARNRRAEESLRESEQELHAVIQGSPIPQFVIDRNHRVIHWNRALEEHTGIMAAEVMGTGLHWKTFYAKERPCLCDLLVDVKQWEIARWYNGKATCSPYVEGAYEVKDFFPDLGGEGKWLHFTAVAIHDRSGAVIGALETLQDITDQVEAEKNLKVQASEVEETQAQLEALFQAFPDAYLRFDPDGTILELRAGDPFPPFQAYDRLLTHRVKDLLAPSEGTLVEQTIREVYGSDRMQVIEFTQEIGGSRRYFEGRFLPLLGSQVMGIFRDITERKAGETALRQANTKLQLLSVIIRHDIRNLLTTLSAYQDLAIETAADPLVPGYLEKEHGITRRIHDLIEFACFYQKIGMTAPTWQDLHEVLGQVVRDQDTRGILVVFDFQGIEVYSDPLLGWAFASIIKNAVCHGERVTRIQFGWNESPAGLLLSCEDDGKGIPADEKESIFGRGSNGPPCHGLFLMREILGITGLTVRETGEYGKGARFEITVPPGNYRMENAPERPFLHGVPCDAPDLRAPPTQR